MLFSLTFSLSSFNLACKNLAQSNEFILRADVVQLLHVNENRAYWLLRKLVNDGVIVPVNRGHYAKYQLNRG